MKFSFWVILFIIFYTYIGYGLLLYVLIKLKQLFIKEVDIDELVITPSITLIVAAYNEAPIIEEKISNTLLLQYPKEQLKIIFITDGSTDGTNLIIAKYPQIRLMHQDSREGKVRAIERAIAAVDTELVVFSDANALLNKEALLKLARHYINPRVGAVSGEKRVQVDGPSDASSGEGFYWKYESILKKWDYALNSVVGAAGELYSIRTALYKSIPPDTLLDDFMISMNIALEGYQIAYDPDAYATETTSENVKEELKRKVRIAAGAIQSLVRTKKLLNPFHYPLLSFQYISHRLLRWAITPFLMIILFCFNVLICLANRSEIFYILLFLQICFYMFAFLGAFLANKQMKRKVLFIPFYFVFMNYAMLLGMFRYLFSSQTVLWDKAKRK